MIDLLWDLHQERRIGDAMDNANVAARKATDFQERVRFLEDRVDRMVLTNMAVWSIVRERLRLTDEDLAARIEQIDLEDGKADGKVTRTGPAVCGRCGRSFSPRHRRCLYCGQESRPATPFDQR